MCPAKGVMRPRSQGGRRLPGSLSAWLPAATCGTSLGGGGGAFVSNATSLIPREKPKPRTGASFDPVLRRRFFEAADLGRKGCVHLLQSRLVDCTWWGSSRCGKREAGRST